jgi:(p)ppGpp synthase/HD superfamily hydrolase
VIDSFDKLHISLRYWILGRGYNVAARAMDFAEKHHTGTRKDGVTPEFAHQVAIAHYIRTLPDLVYPEETLATIFLHDVVEDYDVPLTELSGKFGRVLI